MNGAGVSAAAASPASSAAASGSPATAAGGKGAIDFAALLGGVAGACVAGDAGTQTDTGAGADAGDSVDESGAAAAAAEPDTASAADDGKDDSTDDLPVPADDGKLPDWLLALRQSLNLVGALLVPNAASAPAAATDKVATPAANPPRTPPKLQVAGPAATAPAALLTDTLASLDPADPADVAAIADGGEPQAGATDTPAPTTDRRFDALLTAMADRDAGVTALATGSAGALAAPAAAPTAATPTAAPAPMTVPPDHPQFTGDLGERIVWIADAGLSSAKIELHPLDLGSVQVHVRMLGDEAQVSFAADNPATRALLQDSLPQLREMMSVQGLQLLRAQVEQKVAATRASDGSFTQSGERDEARNGSGTRRRVTRLKLVDAYA